MLERVLDHNFEPEVRQRIGLLTVARMAANACFRFYPPFLATIALGLGVSLERIGVAVAVSELSGLASPLTGALAERFHRRVAMTLGLIGIAVGAVLAAAVPRLVVFAVALVVIGQSKAMFDLGLAAWISDRVPYERRGRVIGLIETAWALGLLVGVTTLGLVAAATSWRVGYLVVAAAVVVLAALVFRVVAPDPESDQPHARSASPGRIVVSPTVVVLALGVFCLMAASQMLIVTWGKWLKDSFGLTDSELSLVVFGLGFCELVASLSMARFADRWGKERAARIGASIMVPAALVLAVEHGHLVPGLVLLMVAIGGFEFAIVSTIPLGTELVTGAPAKGVAVMFTVGTVARAAATVPATTLYQRHGMAWPALGSTLLAGIAVAVMTYLGATRGRRLPMR